MAPLVVVPVVPRNHSIFQKVLKTLDFLINHPTFGQFWIQKSTGTTQFKMLLGPLHYYLYHQARISQSIQRVAKKKFKDDTTAAEQFVQESMARWGLH